MKSAMPPLTRSHTSQPVRNAGFTMSLARAAFVKLPADASQRSVPSTRNAIAPISTTSTLCPLVPMPS